MTWITKIFHLRHTYTEYHLFEGPFIGKCIVSSVLSFHIRKLTDFHRLLKTFNLTDYFFFVSFVDSPFSAFTTY